MLSQASLHSDTSGLPGCASDPALDYGLRVLSSYCETNMNYHTSQFTVDTGFSVFSSLGFTVHIGGGRCGVFRTLAEY